VRLPAIGLRLIVVISPQNETSERLQRLMLLSLVRLDPGFRWDDDSREHYVLQRDDLSHQVDRHFGSTS
jgi:hypothetical protein